MAGKKKTTMAQFGAVEYVALTGINTSEEVRYEAGTVIAGSALPADDIEAFLGMGAIAVNKPVEKAEEKDKDEDPEQDDTDTE